MKMKQTCEALLMFCGFKSTAVITVSFWSCIAKLYFATMDPTGLWQKTETGKE